MRTPRHIGGLDCMEVLAQLSAYLEGDLSPVDRGRVEAHVSACDVCARFGGQFAEAVARLRAQMGPPAAVPEDVQERLRRRLRSSG